MLNVEQREALEEIKRPTLVIAGPGTGKTYLLTEKVASLMEKEGLNPEEILAITFTDKAAREIENRVLTRIGKVYSAYTFHAFSRSILEEFNHLIPEIDENYNLIDESYASLFFYQNISKMNLSSIEVKNNQIQVSSSLHQSISRLREFGVSVSKVQEMEFESLSLKSDIFNAYVRYEQFKRENNFLDFQDLLIYVKKLLDIEEVRLELEKRFSYVLIDEFQDTNSLQFEIMRRIVKDGRISVFADPKQAIYSFRGGNNDSIEVFARAYQNYRKVILHTNYRTGGEILETINSGIRFLKRDEEFLEEEREVETISGKIRFRDENLQEKFILDKIKEAVSNKKTIAVLSRRRSEVYEFSKMLKREKIEHSSSGISNPLLNPLVIEIKTILSFLSSPSENNSDFFYILEGIGIRKECLRKIARKSSYTNKSLYESLKKHIDEHVNGYENERFILEKLINDLEALEILIRAKSSLRRIISEIIYRFEIYQRAEIAKDLESIQSINSIVNIAEDYSKFYKKEDIEGFLSFCDSAGKLRIAHNEEEEEGLVSLMTYHQSKGKEFDIVLMPNLNDRRFPGILRHSMFKTPFDLNKEEYLEEEKRLFFVGISRAREELFLSFVEQFRENKTISRPSQFLNEVSLKDINILGTQDSKNSKISRRDEIKNEILSRIIRAVNSENFEMAKDDINLMRHLFSRGNGLNAYIGSEHPDYEYYLRCLENSSDEPLDFNPKEEIYSVTKLQTYDSCPKKYLYEYVYKVPTVSKHYFDFGTSMHKIFEIMADEIREGVDESILYARLLNLLKKEWVSNAYESAKQEKEYFEKGIAIIPNFIKKQKELISKEARRIDKKEEKFLIEIEGRKIRGVIDRVDIIEKTGEINIIDYKTSNKMESEEQLKENMQLFVYSRAVKSIYGRTPKLIGLWYLIFNDIRNVEFDKLNFEEIEKRLMQIIKGIEERNFKAKPTYFACNYCDFNKICKESIAKN